jgi:hypothetical protein
MTLRSLMRPARSWCMAHGLPVCLNQLRVLLDTDSAPPLVESDENARLLQKVYAKQLALG